jgi:hypothetical protein
MFKKFKLLLIYINILNKNREMLKQTHGISIDWVWRMYKTYVIPTDELDNIKDYGFNYVNQLVQKEISKIDKTFLHIGLSEYVGLMEAIDLTEREIGLAFRFKYLNTAKVFNFIIWFILFLLGGGIGFLIGTFIGLFIGLISVITLYIITHIITHIIV